MNALPINFAPESSQIIHDKSFFSWINNVVAAGGAQQHETAQSCQIAVFAGHPKYQYIILIQIIDILH